MAPGLLISVLLFMPLGTLQSSAVATNAGRAGGEAVSNIEGCDEPFNLEDRGANDLGCIFSCRQLLKPSRENFFCFWKVSNQCMLSMSVAAASRVFIHLQYRNLSAGIEGSVGQGCIALG